MKLQTAASLLTTLQQEQGVPDAFSSSRTFQLIYLKKAELIKIQTRLEGWKGRGTIFPQRRSQDVSGLKLMVLSGLPKLPQHRFLLKEVMSAGNEHQPVVPLSRMLPAPGFKESLRKFQLGFHLIGNG